MPKDPKLAKPVLPCPTSCGKVYPLVEGANPGRLIESCGGCGTKIMLPYVFVRSTPEEEEG